MSHSLGLLAATVSGAALWLVGMSALTAQTATTMTSDQQFFIAVLTVLAQGVGLVAVAAIPVWFARKANQNSEIAAVRAGRAEEKTDKLTETTAEMSVRLDGKLDAWLAKVEEAALLKGAEQERIRADAQKITDAAQVRSDAKEDRAEGMAAMAPQPGQPVVPVITRTEAAEADEKEKPS